MKQKQAKLYQYNTGGYHKLERQKLIFLRESSSINYLEDQKVLDLSGQDKDKMPPMNTLSFYFPNLLELNLSQNRLEDIDPTTLVKSCPNLTKLDLSNNRIKEIKQILELKALKDLADLNIANNPIDILDKRICLLQCLLLDNFKPEVNEKLVVKYLIAPYTKKKVFPACTDDYKYQRDIRRYVSIEEKEEKEVMKMCSVTPRSGGNFRMLKIINGEEITVFDLHEVLYYDKFPMDYDNQRLLYKQLKQDAQDEYQRTTLQKASENTKKSHSVRPKTSKWKPKERMTSKLSLDIDSKAERPETILRFIFQNEVKSMKHLPTKPDLFAQDPAELEGESKRIKERRRENRREMGKIKDTLVSLKKEHEIKDFRYKEITKPLTFQPAKPEIETFQVKAKTVQRDLLDDIFKQKEVQKVESKKKVKILKRLRDEQRQKEQMADILNQTFNSEDMNEGKDTNILQMNDSSSDEEINMRRSITATPQEQIEEVVKEQQSMSSEDEEQLRQEMADRIQGTPEVKRIDGVYDFKSPELVASPLSKQLTYTPKASIKILAQDCESLGNQSSIKRNTVNVASKLAKTQHVRILTEEEQKERALSEHKERGERLLEKEIDKRIQIARQKSTFSWFAGKAHREVYKRKDYDEARKIVREDMFKGHFTYEDLKSSELKMEYIELMRNQYRFKESLDYFQKHKQFLDENPFYREFFNQQNASRKPGEHDINTYEDLVLLYLNCKQAEHSKQDLKKLRKVINKICPGDPDAHYKHKKANVIERIERDLVKMSDQEFTRLQTILNQYSKLDSFPPSIKNFDKWLEVNRARQQKAIEKEELFKRHVERLPSTKANREFRQKEQRENKRVQVSLMNTIKLENNYFLSPKHYHQTLQGSQSVKNITQQNGQVKALHTPSHGTLSTASDSVYNQKQKLSHITKVGFIEKLNMHATQKSINSKKITEGWEPINLQGSIIDYIPQYNRFWNELKHKVFPLGTLEQIIRDPGKYEHTKKIFLREHQKQLRFEELKNILSKKGINHSKKLWQEYNEYQKQVIGSKYRFIWHQDQLYEPPKSQKEYREYGKDVDISGYLDEICEDSQIIEKKKAARAKTAVTRGSQALGLGYQDAKEKFQKAMERESNANPVAHRQTMLKQQQQQIREGVNCDLEYVTRQEMAQLLVTIVQHYEKRIQNLEQAYQQLVQQVNSQQPAKANVLQPNTNIVNNNIKSHLSRPSELMSTDNNSESSIMIPVITAQLKQITQQNLVDEIQHLMQLKPQTTKSSRQPSNMLINGLHIKSQKENSQENMQLHYSNLSQAEPANTSTVETSKKLRVKESAQKPSSCGKPVGPYKKDNYSEIKGKISMFNLQQFQSPSDATSFYHQQHSPEERESNITAHVGANGNFLNSEFTKQYMSSSPDSQKEKEGRDQGDATGRSCNKTSKQMISICTQDHQITEIQSPTQMVDLSGSHSKTALSLKNQMKSQNPLNAYQNISLSVLLEEDSNSHMQNTFSSKNHFISAQPNLDANTPTSHPKQLKDQRHSVGTCQSQQSKYEIQQKPRASTSLGANKTPHSSTTVSNVHHSQSQHRQQNRSATRNNSTNQISKAQRNLKSLLQQSQTQQQVRQFDPQQVNITHALANITHNVSSASNLPAQNTKTTADPSKKIKKQPSIGSNGNNQKKSTSSNQQRQNQINSSNHNSNKNPQHIQTEQSLAKILMPSFTTERLFKMIKTPIGNSRSKPGSNKTYLASEGQKGLQTMNTIDSTFKDHQFSAVHAYTDLVVENTGQNELKESKTFDQSIKEPLTMRDLEIIEQNQFRLSTGSNVKQSEFNSTQRTGQDEKSNTCNFNNIIVVDKDSIRSSLLNTQQISIPKDTELQQDLIPNLSNTLEVNLMSQGHSGSLTQRDSSVSSSQQLSQCASSKRFVASRIAGSSAETRLSNLVQTIQKYKNEAGFLSAENRTNSIKPLIDSQTLVEQFSNFENARDQESQKETTSKKSLSKQSQNKGSVTSLKDKNILISSNSSEGGSQRSSHRSGRDSLKLRQDREQQEVQQDECDNFEINTSGIQVQISNVVITTNSNSEALASQIEVIDQKTQQAKEALSQDSELYSRVEICELIDREELVRTSGHQSLSNQKSRNGACQPEYFSFSNLEREQQLLMKSEASLHSQRQLNDFQTQQDKFLLRSDTMIQLTVSKSNDTSRQHRYKFTDLTGDILDLISEYLPGSEKNIPPFFVLSNHRLLSSYSKYKSENFGIQVEILIDQIGELKRELFDYFDQKLFKMSKGLSIIYYSNINSKEWGVLEELCKDKILNKEDQTLMRVYLLLLGTKPKQTSGELHEQLHAMISEHKNRLNQIFNPELHFTFGPQILCHVGQLLQSFSLENYIINYSKTTNSQSRKIRTLQILAQIVYEALQFCKIVPNRIESDIRELERVIDHYSRMQEKLNRYITASTQRSRVSSQ